MAKLDFVHFCAPPEGISIQQEGHNNGQSRVKKILIAAGGTGGHLFPAQALAEQLLQENKGIALFFAGAALSTTPYFDRERFRFYDIRSATLFRGSLFKAFRSLGILIWGIKESCQLLSKEKPVLVVGFGSFHVFPLLCAALLKRIPIILFESNAIPGKVVRLFSKKAELTGIYFKEAEHYLKGKSVEVEIPVKPPSTPVNLSKQQLRKEMDLEEDLPTLLVFGGSQGAQGINRQMHGMLSLLKQEQCPFQLIHFTGCEERAAEISTLCGQLEIPCYIRKFEKRIERAWGAADVVICRAGAMTLSELLHYEVPGILIPYPAAADQHQLKNALFIEKKVGGGVHMVEKSLTPETLAHSVFPLIVPGSPETLRMKTAIKNFKSSRKKSNFCHLILERVQ